MKIYEMCQLNVEKMTDKKITFRYILAVVMAVIFTWIIHELAHWLTHLVDFQRI